MSNSIRDHKAGTKWPNHVIDWLRNNYALLGGPGCAAHLGVNYRIVNWLARRYKIAKGKKKRRPVRQYDELAICEAYRLTRNLGNVAKTFKSSPEKISNILTNHGIKIKIPSLFMDNQEAIIKDYQANEISLTEIANKYGISITSLRSHLKKTNVYDPTRQWRFPNRINYYDCWVKRYGIEEANRREVAFQAKRLLTAKRGTRHPRYGVASPQGSGTGLQGWYRKIYFRSLREAIFMIRLDSQGIEWKTGETKEYTIPYEFRGKNCTYKPDFVICKELWEIKPLRWQTSPVVIAKKQAAEAFCAERGLTYRMEDVEIDRNIVIEAMDKGLLIFDVKSLKRFIEYVD